MVGVANLTPAEVQLYYIPVAIFLFVAVLTRFALPDWRSEKFLRDPKNPMWASWHVLGQDRWTVEGLKLRNRYFRRYLFGLVLAAVAHLILASLLGGQ